MSQLIVSCIQKVPLNHWKIIGADGGTRTLTAILPRDFKSLASTIPPRPRGFTHRLRGGEAHAGGVSNYSDNTCPQDDCQSLPPASVTLPSFSKNLLGT